VTRSKSAGAAPKRSANSSRDRNCRRPGGFAIQYSRQGKGGASARRRHRYFFPWVRRADEPRAALYFVLAAFETPIAAWNGHRDVLGAGLDLCRYRSSGSL
jgi:hypothetical protein